MLHAQRAEHVLAQVAAQRNPGDVLDDLAEHGEPVIGVGTDWPAGTPQPSAGRSRSEGLRTARTPAVCQQVP